VKPQRQGQMREAVYGAMEKYGRDVSTTTLMEVVAKKVGKMPSLHTIYTYRSEWLKVNRLNNVQAVRSDVMEKVAELLANCCELLAQCPAA